MMVAAAAAPPASLPLSPSPQAPGDRRTSRRSHHPPPSSSPTTFQPASTLDGKGGEEEAERRPPRVADAGGTGTDGGDGDAVAAADEIRDPLLPHLIVAPSSTSSGDATTDVRTALLTEGYCLIQSVLTRQECTSFLDDLWDFVEVTSCGRVRRDDPATYYPRRRHLGHDVDSNRDDGADDDEDDPWPCSGWGSFPDMFQTNGAGWLHGKLREILATRVFGPLVFGTEKLHCSKEGFTFHRPRRYRRRQVREKSGGWDADDDEGDDWEWVNKCHPSYKYLDHHSDNDSAADKDRRRRRDGRTFRVCGRNQNDVVGEHFDQSSSSLGLCHVQSATSFLDQSSEDGCFLCWPGSHVYHRRLTEGTYRGKFPWVPLTDDDLRVLREEGGLSPVRVHVNAGDVILWRSDLVHAALSPSPRAAGFRAVAYVGMMPAELTEESVWKRKLDGYRQIRTGDHRADVEVWHDEGGGRRRRRVRSVKGAGANGVGEASVIDEAVVGDRGGVVPPYFCHGPPRLTWRQAELYGLVPYGITPEGRPDAIRRALARGVRFVAKVEAEASST